MVKFHLRAQHTTSRRSEVHSAMPNTESPSSGDFHYCMVTSTALLACGIISLFRDPDLSKEAAGCLQPDWALPGRVFLHSLAHRFFSFKQAPYAYILRIAFAHHWVFLRCWWTHPRWRTHSMTIPCQSHSGSWQVVFVHQQDRGSLRGGQRPPPDSDGREGRAQRRQRCGRRGAASTGTGYRDLQCCPGLVHGGVRWRRHFTER